ncbi:sensor histidine kinase [Campylobacter anatolicus]
MREQENIKFYTIIVILSVLMVMLGINVYQSAKTQIVDLSNKDKATISKNIVQSFSIWVDERINSLQRASKFIENGEMVGDDNEIKKFIKIFSQNAKEFDAVQLMYDDGKIFINGEYITSVKDDVTKRHNLIWYAETKDSGKPTINFMPRHSLLDEPTLNLCVPTYKGRSGQIVAVLCGIVKAKSIFDNIKNFKLPPNAYSFLITHSGEMLTPMSNEKLKNDIERSFKEMFLTGDPQGDLVLGTNFISLEEIPSLNWFIGAGADNEMEINELLNVVSKNAFVLFLAFIILVAVSNFLHSFMYNTMNKRKKEYEIILSHKARVGEIGELISGINHQFIQPVNSLKLMISSLQMLQNENKLDNDTLKSMLNNGSRSVALLSKTIDIFRNFYKTSENISEFGIRQSIINVLTLVHSELSYANVSVILKDFEDKKVNQIENIIQQILLILIHNAKDALVDKFEDISQREIIIDAKFDTKKCYILVSDFGYGLSYELSMRIFAEPKTTKKHGNGIGLYFGKKFANDNINGDVRLINRANPTMFELSFDIDLKDKK